MRRIRFLVFALVVFVAFSAAAVALADASWREEDFAFYNADMSVLKRPAAGPESDAGIIRLQSDEKGQTYRGIRIGSYPEELLSKYDFSDAEWTIHYANREDREKVSALSEKWRAEGKTGADIISMSDFLFSRGFYYEVKLNVYKYNGRFVTRSMISQEEQEAMMHDLMIDSTLLSPDNEMTREELEKEYDDWYARSSGEDIEYYISAYLNYDCRAMVVFSVRNDMVESIEITDYYYNRLQYAYNDDGTVNTSYAFFLDLK